MCKMLAKAITYRQSYTAHIGVSAYYAETTILCDNFVNHAELIFLAPLCQDTDMCEDPDMCQDPDDYGNGL